MNNKNKYHKKQRLKRKANQDDLNLHKDKPGPRLSKQGNHPLRPSNRLSKKNKLKVAFTKRKQKMSSHTSSSHSTVSGKDLQKDGSDDAMKSQCDLCKLSYSNKDKLAEHLVSLMHHTKLEDAGENPKHDCALCNMGFKDMSSYRDHIVTKKHLRNLEFLRNPTTEKQHHNPKNQQHNRNRRDNCYNGQESRYQNAGRYNQFYNNNNTGWQGPDFPRGLNQDNFNQGEFFNNFGSNLLAFKNLRQYAHQQGPYGSNQSSNNYHHDGWGRDQGPWNDGMEFENYNNVERNNLPWGSGAPAMGNKLFQGNFNMNNGRNNFMQDNFDLCWDEQSFQQHENFLANMDQGYHRDSVEFHPRGRHPNYSHQGGVRHDGPPPDTGFNRKWRWDDSLYNDRKRPRNEDYPIDPTPKSSKPLDKGKAMTEERPIVGTNDVQPTAPSAPKSKPTPQNVTKTATSKGYEKTAAYQTKSSLDNASDTILERAEKLCKELREKREASSSQRATLLKTQTQHSLNDKMNTLKKNKQSYLKGHIHASPTDQNSTEDSASAITSISNASALPGDASKDRLSQNKPTSLSKGKTLDEIRKSIEQSVLDNTKNTQGDKVRNRVRASSLSESPSAQSGQSRGRVDPTTADTEGRHTRPIHKLDRDSGTSKPGTKQPITKENLNKMVNCPRSRTERLQLARMFQSRADNKSSAHVSSRSNINLEGLYDAPDTADIEIDVGGNLPTIKLEDLSDDVRSQILGLIQDDIGSQMTDVIEIDGDDAPHTGASHGELLANVTDSTDKKLKKKSQKKTKTTSNSDLISESIKLAKPPEVNGTVCNKKTVPEKSRSCATPTSQDQISSSRLTRDNVLAKYPTILGNMGTGMVDVPSTVDITKSPAYISEKDKNSVDSGRSSMVLSSLSSSPMPVLSGSSPIPSSSYSSLPRRQPSQHTPTQPTVSVSPSVSAMTAPFEEAVSLLNNYPSHRKELPNKDSSDVRSSIASSINGDAISANTMSELLTLSEQEESVKQEMMSMELRLTRLHRLLEQAVYQINKCTERRNELQEEEKSLTSRRLSLLREATSSSSQPSGPTVPIAVAPSSQTQPNTESSSTTANIATSASDKSTTSKQPLPSTTDLPPPTQQQDPHNRPETTLSRTEWLAKFSAYLPSNFIPSNQESTSKNQSSNSQLLQISEADGTHTGQSVSSTTIQSGSTSALSQAHTSLDTARFQMVPERDLAPSALKESYTSFNSINCQLTNDRLDSSSKDKPHTDTNSKANNNTDKYTGAAQEFTSPIMYLGTIKSGAAQTQSRLPAKAPVMMLNSATLSSLFSGGTDRGDSVNPMKIIGLGDRGDLSSSRVESTIPPVIRRTSLESPRQEDSDIGSIASVASGSSLGEQITRYCRFTPGASADGQNPHDLSVILSGPSDTSDLRGLEEDDGDDDFGERRVDRSGNNNDDGAENNGNKSSRLMEDAGNSRLYGQLDQESIKSAEALHLMERNNESPSAAIDRKKKKRKTKHQRDSRIKGRSKPYVISSSSGDDNRTKTPTTDENCVSSLEQKLRKSPESTDEDSSDQPIITRSHQAQTQSGRSSRSPSKSDHITIAECDSSTNLGMVDSESLNESSNRLKELNESFEKTFGRKPRSKISMFENFKKPESNVVVLSDDDSEANCQESSQPKESNSQQVIDLCDGDDVDTRRSSKKRNQHKRQSRFPGNLGPVCFIRCLEDKIYVGFLKNGFKVFSSSPEDSVQYSSLSLAPDRLHPFPKMSCMEVSHPGDWDNVMMGCGDWVVTVNMKVGKRSDLKTIDMGTSVQCLHAVKPRLFTGLDTGEMCVHDMKTWKLQHRYICSDCPIQCMASGTEGGTRVLCVASADSTITVVDADRCLPLRILTGHKDTALSVQVYGQFVFSGSADGAVIIHNMHTASIEKAFKDNKGGVNSVYYSRGHLFTAGVDRLVRVYNVKTHKLVQVYYGAGAGVVSIVCVQDEQLVTGNCLGAVDFVDLDLTARFPCKRKKCGLTFGLASHLAWHMEEEH